MVFALSKVKRVKLFFWYYGLYESVYYRLNWTPLGPITIIIRDAVFMKEGYWSKRVDVQRAAVQSSELNIHLISQEYGITALLLLLAKRQKEVLHGGHVTWQEQ